MASPGAGEEKGAALVRSLSLGSSSRRIKFASVSSNSWASASAREVFTAPKQDAFQRIGREYDDQDELMWAAIGGRRDVKGDIRWTGETTHNW